jgi:hypothetical protein
VAGGLTVTASGFDLYDGETSCLFAVLFKKKDSLSLSLSLSIYFLIKNIPN